MKVGVLSIRSVLSFFLFLKFLRLSIFIVAGEFKTNFILPNYIGLGNGITRGFGTIYGMFNPETFSFDKEALIEDANDQESEPLDSIG